MKARPARRWFLLSFILLLLIILLLMPAEADGPNRAGLVIDYGDGNTATFCVEFDEESITGMEVLERAGRELALGFGGGTVCAIDGVGCPSDNCWCECGNASQGCTYWIYWHLKDGEWRYSEAGAAGYPVYDGDIEGWVWGSGSTQGGAPPPVYTIEQICNLPPPQTDTPTATNTPTSTHTPTPSSTPTATNTPAPANTPEVSFHADTTELVAGSCTTLRWDVEDVHEVYLDGQPRQGHGSKQVCPTQTQTYELRVVNAAGEFRHQVTVNVVQPSPTPIPSDEPTLLPTAAPAPTDTPEPQPEVPSPTPTPLPAEVPPLTATPLPAETATPTLSPPVMAMVAPPTAPAKKETDALSKADQPAEISPTKVTILNWLLFLVAAVVGTLGFGGMAFVGILAVLGVIYLFARWSQDGGDHGEEGNVDGYH
jgi:hypothetical protein